MYLNLARFWLTAFLLFWVGSTVSVAQTASLRGLVVDASNGEPLPTVNVALQNEAGRLSGTSTNADGYFLANRIRPGQYVLIASFLGYATYRDTLQFEPSEQKVVNFGLHPSNLSMDEVVVTANVVGQSVAAAGFQTITPKQINVIPTPDISGDLMAYLQVLPGVMSPGDRGGQLFIRGGTPAQNLILLDGMPLFQPFHIIGFFSAFPSEIIRTADIYAGGFGAKYGGRLSSVIDITTRNGNKQRFEGSASVATFLTSLHAEGPLNQGKTSFIGSIRESFTGQVLPTTIVGDLPFEFGDEFLKVHSNLTDGSQLSVTFINSHDRGTIDETESLKSDDLSDLLNVSTEPTTDEIKWRNTSIGFRLVSVPEVAPIFGELTGSFTNYVNEFGNPANPDRRSSARIIRSTTALAHKIDRIEFRWGAALELVELDYDLNGVFQDLDSASDSYVEFGPFVDVGMQPTGNLSINPGLRIFFVSGEQTAIRLEPRIRSSWFPAGFAAGHELSAAIGLYHQNLVGLLDERDAGDVFTAWTFPQRGGGLPSAIHGILGWRSLVGSLLELGLEGYYKTMSHLAVPAWSAFPRFTTTLQDADGEVYGLDARVSLNAKFFNLFASYGLQRVEYTASQESFGIWFGTEQESYFPPHDRRHRVNVVLGTKLFGLADLDIRWEYGSGVPYTRPFGFDDWIFFETLPDVTKESGEYRVSFERPYEGRLPPYHRLDVSIKRGFDFATSRLTLQIGLFNAYDRSNLFYFDVWTLNRVDQMALVPSFGIKWETR